MTGRQWTITSPSRTSSSLSTPCVEGCCGPILTVSSSRFSPTSIAAIHLPCDGEVDGLGPQGLAAAKGVGAPFVGHHDPAQIWVALELDAKQVEELALVPVGTRHDRGDAGRLTVGARL